MSIIYVLLSLSLGVAILFFILFILSVRKGQYEDIYTPSVRMLFDDELVKKEKPKNTVPHHNHKKIKNSTKGTS